MLFNYQHTKDDIKRILLAGFSACGGSLQRHNSSPPQCDPTQRAFYIIGNSSEFPIIKKELLRSRNIWQTVTLLLCCQADKIIRFATCLIWLNYSAISTSST